VLDGSLPAEIVKTGSELSDDPKLLFDELNQDKPAICGCQIAIIG
jgi:hypothetical protein